MKKKFFTLLCLCVLCIGSAWGDYVKVTSAPTDWSGEYLLVYDNGANSVAWTGVDAPSCNVSVTISNERISAKPDKAVTITIAPMTGGYSIKVNGGDNNGKFIKGTSGSNTLGFETTAQLNTISYDTENNGVLITSNTSVMRYNDASNNLRFRYFKSTSYSAQKIVQLYKKEVATVAYTVTLGDTGEKLTESAAGVGVTLPERTTTNPNYKFAGWANSKITNEQTEAPTLFNADTYHPSSNIVLYPIFVRTALVPGGETLSQTLQYDTWSFGGTTSDQTKYRLFGNGGYVESEAFDLGSLKKVIVYGGTYGGDSYKSLTIGDGTNTWKSVEVSGKSETGKNEYTGGTLLSGKGNLRIISKSGNGTSTGVRISKVEIYVSGMVETNYYISVVPFFGYTRDFTNNNFGTLCLPYSATIEGAEVYSVESVEYDNENKPSKLYLTKVEGATEKGVPYIIKPKGNQLVATYSGEATETAGNANGLYGSFEKVKIKDGASNYILQNSLWCYVKDGNENYVGANKAYLNLADVKVKSSGAKGDFEMIFDGEVTNINLVPTTEEMGGTMYNLNGMQVNANYKGIVIVKGKKYLNK